MNRKAPRIGITLRTTGVVPDSYDWREHYRFYVDAVRAAGGEPVPLTADSTDPVVFDLHSIDGLLLAGGGDIDPGYYGESPNGTEVEGIDLARDELELSLARRAIDGDLPVFGICRGIQTLNVALGGGLVQHVPDHRIRTLDGGGWVQHWVDLAPGSSLAEMLGAGQRVVVNSHHHQAVTLDRLAQGLAASAVDVPGGRVVEAVEHPGRRWVVAVQWHPERWWEVSEAHRRLFESFVEAATTRPLPRQPSAGRYPSG